MNRSDSDVGRWRWVGVRALVVLASLVAVLALVAGYARQTVVNSDQFANRATEALRDDSVKTLIAEKITDEVVLEQKADLVAARPLIESVTSEIVGGRAFTELFRKAVRDVHRSLFKQDRDTVTLTIADIGTVLAAALQHVRPDLAEQVGSSERVEVLNDDIGSLSAALADIAERVRLLALLLALLAVALAAAALWLSPDRRTTVIELGLGLAAAGGLLVVAYSIVRSVAVDHVDGPDEQAAARAVWDAFVGDLRTEGWLLAGAGAVMAAAASSLVKPLPFGAPVRTAAEWIAREPERTVWRVVRGVAFVAAGVLVLVDRSAVLTLLMSALGIYLIYEGVSMVLRLVYREEDHGAPGPEPRTQRRVRRRRLAAGLLPAILIIAVVASFAGTGAVTTAAPPDGTCNGHLELCDRPLNEVSLATTHNSMSVPLPGWYSSMQEAPIADQLHDGIRGLQIDTHYADKLPNGKIRTYFGSNEELKRRVKADGVSPDSVDAALRIRDRLGFEGEGERGMYLCHSFCELGATPLDSVLDDIRTFLVANPGAVLVVINQDYVKPEDFVGAVRDAGLEQLAYDGPVDGTWQTLREMTETGKRVVFLAENHAGGAPWYRLAYKSITEETPYSFSKVAQLNDPSKLAKSCAPNRGPEGAPVFLVNHWITTDPVPLPSNAEKVNAYDKLLARVKECRRIRHHLPNLVAVNFYREGDVFGVVDTLNGLK
ncbi:MAG TPA: hypothetical protein VJT68_07095 [Thermoleophilaceae bacterium]|nr:hypothetical protein [Thermoleophilaceae bacterium]